MANKATPTSTTYIANKDFTAGRAFKKGDEVTQPALAHVLRAAPDLVTEKKG